MSESEELTKELKRLMRKRFWRFQRTILLPMFPTPNPWTKEAGMKTHCDWLRANIQHLKDMK